jgi:hypothetical protein
MIFLPNTAEAVQWWKNGDHPLDNSTEVDGELTEGEVVTRYVPPTGTQHLLHTACGAPWGIHGVLQRGSNPVVCPGDWIVRGNNNHYRVAKPTIYRTEEGVEPDAPHTAHWHCGRCTAAGTAATIDDATTEAAVHATAESHTVWSYGIITE